MHTLMNNNLSMENMITSYTRSENGKRVIILQGSRPSFRCRQRSIMKDNTKSKPMKFVSFKETQQIIKKNDTKVIGPFDFYTISKL